MSTDGVVMRTHQIIAFTLLLMAAQLSSCVLAQAAPPNAASTSTGQDAGEHLSFVREFSGSQDLNVSHSLLSRSFVIFAGAKEKAAAEIALQDPYSVTTDSAHRILVTDVRAGSVHVFDFAHSKYSLLQGGDHLLSPLGIAADHEGNVYVSDRGLRSVLVFDSRGRFVHYLNPSVGGKSYFDGPRGIAVDAATGRIYVCDTPKHLVMMLDKNGQILGHFGIPGGGSGPGEFRFPTEVVAAGKEIVVLDSGNSRAQILDAGGHFQKEIRLARDSNRVALAVDSDENIYVTDPYMNRLEVFDREGQFLYEFGHGGKDAGQFNGISGIWVDSGHCLYVVDSDNKRVQLFQIGRMNPHGCL